MILKSSPSKIWSKNWVFIRVMYFGGCQWRPIDLWDIPDPNEPPIFVWNMDWGWPQDHFHLKQCRTTLKDGQARDQRPIGLQIDLWPLAQPSLRVVLHCFRWKWSWSHPQVRFETKIGCSLGSCTVGWILLCLIRLLNIAALTDAFLLL